MADPALVAAGKPVAPVATAAAPQDLQALDDPLEWQQFSESGAPTVQGQADASPIEAMHSVRSHVALHGITCAACAITIEDALRAVPGVTEVRVSAASARAQVTWQPAVTRPSAWMGAVARAGYRADPAPDGIAHEDLRLERRRMLWRWIVAGFCMMQVMMYAVPAYTAAPGEIGPDSLQLLRWASWVLTLPVMFFSCSPFFASAWRDLRRGAIGMDVPVSLGIAITFVVSTAVTFGGGPAWGHEVWFDSLTMFVFFLLSGRWLELHLRARTTGALDALARRVPASVERLLDGDASERISPRRLRVGDRLRVAPGEAFAADGVILRGQTHVDEALLTGEADALARGAGARVLAGSHNLSASVDIEVTALGRDTRYGDIIALIERASIERPALVAMVDRLARPFLIAVLAAAALTAVWWFPTDPSMAWSAAVAVLIVTCPCALSLATPAALLSATGALARGGVLARSLGALERLARVDTVVLDKTGTLTHERLRVSGLQVSPRTSEAAVWRMAGLLAARSLHPVSRAVAEAAQLATQDEAPSLVLLDVREQAGQGLAAHVLPLDGEAFELRLGSARWCSDTEAAGQGGTDAGQTTRVVLADAQGWLARFDLDEQLRDDALAALQDLQQLGISTRLLSGDRPEAVTRIAQRAGITEAQGGCSPQAKLDALAQWQSQGHRVAMVGDGVNDAPVLARADVSFAMGHAAALAQSRADYVVLGNRLGDIARSVRMARDSMRVIRQNLAWALAYNAISVPVAAMGWLPAWAAGIGMASSSLLVVANAARLARRTNA